MQRYMALGLAGLMATLMTVGLDSPAQAKKDKDVNFTAQGCGNHFGWERGNGWGRDNRFGGGFGDRFDDRFDNRFGNRFDNRFGNRFDNRFGNNWYGNNWNNRWGNRYTGNINNIQDNLLNRINRGVANGRISEQEATRLRRQYDNIAQMETRLRQGGLSFQERQRLLNRLSVLRNSLYRSYF